MQTPTGNEPPAKEPVERIFEDRNGYPIEDKRHIRFKFIKSFYNASVDLYVDLDEDIENFLVKIEKLEKELQDTKELVRRLKPWSLKFYVSLFFLVIAVAGAYFLVQKGKISQATGYVAGKYNRFQEETHNASRSKSATCPAIVTSCYSFAEGTHIFINAVRDIPQRTLCEFAFCLPQNLTVRDCMHHFTTMQSTLISPFPPNLGLACHDNALRRLVCNCSYPVSIETLRKFAEHIMHIIELYVEAIARPVETNIGDNVVIVDAKGGEVVSSAEVIRKTASVHQTMAFIGSIEPHMLRLEREQSIIQNEAVQTAWTAIAVMEAQNVFATVSKALLPRSIADPIQWLRNGITVAKGLNSWYSFVNAASNISLNSIAPTILNSIWLTIVQSKTVTLLEVPFANVSMFLLQGLQPYGNPYFSALLVREDTLYILLGIDGGGAAPQALSVQLLTRDHPPAPRGLPIGDHPPALWSLPIGDHPPDLWGWPTWYLQPMMGFTTVYPENYTPTYGAVATVSRTNQSVGRPWMNQSRGTSQIDQLCAITVWTEAVYYQQQISEGLQINVILNSANSGGGVTLEKVDAPPRPAGDSSQSHQRIPYQPNDNGLPEFHEKNKGIIRNGVMTFASILVIALAYFRAYLFRFFAPPALPLLTPSHALRPRK